MSDEQKDKDSVEGLQESASKDEDIKKDAPSKQKRQTKKDYVFDPKSYKCMVKIGETIKQKYVHKGRLVEEYMQTGRTIEVERFRTDFIKANPNEDIAKCRFRAAEFFMVSVDHLLKAYDILNSKKLDGFYITDLLDRFGFSKGAKTAINRSALATKYGRANSHCVDVAQEKLKGILNNNNIQKAYKEHVDLFKEEFSRETDDKTIYGE